MSKKSSDHLSKDEIEEELLNNELMNSGGIENEAHLQKLNFSEKKSLLRGIQPKEEFPNETNSQEPPILDSTSNFPLLPIAGKSNSKNKLKLPRKTNTGTFATDSDDNSEKCISLLDDEEDVIPIFSLPFCCDDGAQPLVLVDRPQKRNKNPYYVNDGENPAAALKRMLAQHKQWKEAYTAEAHKIDSHAPGEDIECSDSSKQRDSPKNDKIEEKENDPYHFVSNSPVCNSKSFSGPRKRETNMSVDNSPLLNNRQLQRKTSRDSDCEEVEPILKTEEPKMSEWRTANRPRTKRNRKQQPNPAKGQVFEESHDVEFDFDNKWDSQSSSWRGSPSPSSSSLNNQVTIRKNTPNSPVVEEKKVQCPICQRNFAISKVENHAATCEGFSSSPMDIEEET